MNFALSRCSQFLCCGLANARFIALHESKVHQILAKFGKVVDSVIEFVSNLLVIGYQMIKITAFFLFIFPVYHM